MKAGIDHKEARNKKQRNNQYEKNKQKHLGKETKQKPGKNQHNTE